jgi:hypothetical protein
MEKAPLTRAYLQTLTTGDLLIIADDLGVDLPEISDRVIIIEELLDVTSPLKNGIPDLEEPEMNDVVLVESVPLPKHYNITFIEVMIRDHLWAYVFWEIRDQDKIQLEKAIDFGGYYLKVSRIEYSKESSSKLCESLYTAPVKAEDTAWYLGLSPAFEDENLREDNCFFKVEICTTIGGLETVLAASNPVKLPRPPELTSCEGKQDDGGNQLIRLSGYGDFYVLRKSTRPVRTK